MKVNAQDRTTEAAPIFPKLYQSTNGKRVVLFTDYNVGIQLLPEVSKLEDDWVQCTDITCWKPFVGEITLSND